MLVMAPNNVDSTASMFNSSSPCWLVTPSQLIHCSTVMASLAITDYSMAVQLGWSLQLLLAFASSHSWIHLLDMYMFRNGASSSTKEGLVYVGVMFVAPQFQHEYICAVTASSSLWTLCSLCHCTVLSNIYTGCTKVSCQCSLLQQVMP
jgi:hypothetical protein